MSAKTTAEANKHTVRRHVEEVANNGNIDFIDEIFAEDAIDHSPLGVTQGRRAVKEQFEYVFSSFGNVSMTVEDIVGEGDTVALRVTQRARHEGEFMGIEPTGREFEMEIQTFFRFENGRIAERWARPDTLGLMRQLGVIEPPGG